MASRSHATIGCASNKDIAESVADLTKTIDFIEGINSALHHARSDLQSEVGSRNNGGPPLDGARARPPPETAGAMNILTSRLNGRPSRAADP
jgi:hypothetical protein